MLHLKHQMEQSIIKWNNRASNGITNHQMEHLNIKWNSQTGEYVSSERRHMFRLCVFEIGMVCFLCEVSAVS